MRCDKCQAPIEGIDCPYVTSLCEACYGDLLAEFGEDQLEFYCQVCGAGVYSNDYTADEWFWLKKNLCRDCLEEQDG